MGTFDIRQDAPGLLRSESLNITLKFDRTGPTTGRISWNVPSPAAGCTADTQAYCGMLLAIDTTPTTASKLPTNTTVYTSDPTGDSNLHAGDKLGTALVVGAVYHDRLTTFIDITGLKQSTPYYVSGFPVDCEFRYFKEGVHAYSMNSDIERGQIHEDTNGSQTIVLKYSSEPTGVQATDVSGLAPGVDYEFTLQLGVIPKPKSPTAQLECVPSTTVYTISISGERATTYGELVDEINRQISLLDNPPRGPFPPNTNAYFYNTSTKKLFLWDGEEHVEQPVILGATSPTGVVDGVYWLNTTTNVLSVRISGAWVAVNVIELSSDPTNPACHTVWYNGTQAYMWDGNVWLPKTTFIQTQDPSLSSDMVCGTYWYNTTSAVLSKWDDTLNMWTVTTAVQYHEDPTNLSTGALWINETENLLYSWAGGWTNEANFSVSESAPTTPAPGKFWYKPTTMELFQRNLSNTAWVAMDVILFPTDPADMDDGELWWNTDTDGLSVYDGVNSNWEPVTLFLQQAADPSDPLPTTNGDVWVNPNTGIVHVWEDVCFKVKEAITWSTDPTQNLMLGVAWHNTTNSTWQVWNGTSWDVVVPSTVPTDPTALAAGTYWINTSTTALQVWNGIAWVTLTYSTYPLTPTTGALWFDDSTNVLKKWNGTQWVAATTKATASLTCGGNLQVVDNNPGSLSFVKMADITLLQSLNVAAALLDPQPGSDGVSTEPTYQELGIGTDGSGDERRKLMNEIRYELGYPTVDVELTPEQLDFAITKAIEELRSRSAVAYKHGFFFMRVAAETQRYLLTNKTQEMNKIVTILGIHRLTSAFLSSAHGAGVYGQIVLQHLYNMGTFDLLSYHLMAEYTELMEIMFAGRITFTWDETKRELWIHHRFPFSERMVLIEATVERAEQDIISDRWCRTWVRKYAASAARMMLAETRGKYASLPGAGGSVSLNANDLRQQAKDDMEACMLDLDNYVADKPDDYGMGAQFVLG